MSEYVPHKTGFPSVDDNIKPLYLRPGSVTAIGALAHNYRTGFLVELIARFANANNPKATGVMKEGSRPTIVLHKTEEYLEYFYTSLYSFTQAIPLHEAEEVPPLDRRTVVETYFHERGYQLVVCSGTLSDLYRTLDNLVAHNGVANGLIGSHDVRLLAIDNIHLTFGYPGGPKGEETVSDWLLRRGESYRTAIRNLRTYCIGHDITCAFTHTLSMDALEIRRNIDVEDFLASVAGKGYWDGFRPLAQEVDNELYITLAKRPSDGVRVRRGKFRPCVTEPTDAPRDIAIPFRSPDHFGLDD